MADATRGRMARPVGGWLRLARVGWVLAALALLGMDALGTPALLRQARVACASGHCASFQLSLAQARQLAALGMPLGAYAAYSVALSWTGTLVFVLIAAVIWWRRPDDGMALLGAFTLLIFGAAVHNAMEALPASNAAWALPATLSNIAGQVSFYLFFCLFPSGRFVPRWMRWPALFVALCWVATLFPNLPIGAAVTGATPFFFGALALLIFAQVYRYRRASSAIERQQTKWVVFGCALALGTFIALLVVGNLLLSHHVRDSEPGQLIASTVLTVLLLCVPLSIGVAILRSRLWDIDVLINRALVYGSLTAALAALYLGVVVGLQALATALTRQPKPQPLVIVATTLLVAALVQPLRRALQQGIDRRFYRRKYDAARTLARFGATLRTETDLDQLSAHLVTVVDDTMRPAHVTLWLAHHAPPHSQREGLG
jgi:hypothetical protein